MSQDPRQDPPESAEKTGLFSADSVLAGRYRLLTKLGEGGMGTVYLAQDTKLDRQVALKMLPPESVNDAHAVARFEREAKALAKLSHPGIVQAHDTGSADGQHFLVMEYVEGISLAHLLREKGRISPTQAADYIHQAALALQHAHEKGLIHRDLKPSNLLLTPSGQVKLLDLGLARFLQDQIGDPNLTREGMGVGTPDYAAPEQFRDARHADVRSDIYSLGCTLYQFVTGRVPFAGSSLAEKCHAHENLEATPVEELCPDTPLGLSLVISRMMAKNPADRFQSAGELATALGAFVAGSSLSSRSLRNTATWHQGQLTMTDFRAGPVRRRRWWLAAATAGSAALLLLLAGLQFGWFGGAAEDAGPVAGNGQEKEPAEPKDKEPKDKPTPPSDPKVLTVSLDPKDGGDFRTINAGLDKAKPGMTIRVLDKGPYQEGLLLTRAGSQARLTLEAPKGAELILPGQIEIRDVPAVTLRGFHLRASDKPDGEMTHLIRLQGACPGVLLEGLHLQPRRGSGTGSIDLWNIKVAKDEPPVVVQNCTCRGGLEGIRVLALQFDVKTPLPCGGIMLRDNLIVDAQLGIVLLGAVHSTHVVGNRIAGANWSGAIHVAKLFSETKDILIANNTVLESKTAVMVMSEELRGKNITLVNNLLLSPSGPDMLFVTRGPKGNDPQNGADILGAWTLRKNRRETRPPKDDAFAEKAWIPPSPEDVVTDQVKLRSRVLEEAGYLQPAKDSPLATGGAGGDLPAYVGAVPPEGAEPWNWQWTWDAYVNKRITVSKKPAEGGRFRTIRDALAVVQPQMTIRVLGSDTYPGPMEINEPGRMQGLTLEAEHDAVIELPPDTKAALQIRGVPRVTLRGFRFTGKDSSEGLIAFVFARSACPGLRLERLNFQSSKVVTAVVILNADLKDDDPPIVVRECSIQTAGDGIYLAGVPTGPTRRVLLLDNRIHGPQRGTSLNGCLQHVLVAGNQVWDCRQAGLHFEDLAKECQAVVVVNNSIADCRTALRVWHNPPFLPFEKNQALLANNLLLASESGDVLYFRSEKKFKSEERWDGKTAESAFLLDLWTFKRNARDMLGTEQRTMLPLAKDDRKITQNDLESRQAGAANFLRPKAASLLASAGAGKDDPSLPGYIGAVPPPGVEPWDWNITWKKLFGKEK